MQNYALEAQQEWDHARTKAFWTKFWNNLRGKNVELRDFNEISQRLHLQIAVYRGVQLVPLDKIVGSVGRYRDFTGHFLPSCETVGARWRRIASVYLDPLSGGVPPIELYKVGEAYFVRDGNHRVSVAHELGIKQIDAQVWEYPLDGVPAEADLDTFLLEAERRNFLKVTRLDKVRPQNAIRLSVPGGYDDLLAQIAWYQQALSQIDGCPVSYPDAVTAWYDLLYETTAQIIGETGALEMFPNRTAADFYVWIARHRRALLDCCGEKVTVEEAVNDLSRNHPLALLRKSWRSFRQHLGH